MPYICIWCHLLGNSEFQCSSIYYFVIVEHRAIWNFIIWKLAECHWRGATKHPYRIKLGFTLQYLLDGSSILSFKFPLCFHIYSFESLSTVFCSFSHSFSLCVYYVCLCRLLRKISIALESCSIKYYTVLYSRCTVLFCWKPHSMFYFNCN